jgi:hypothetical protein
MIIQNKIQRSYSRSNENVVFDSLFHFSGPSIFCHRYALNLSAADDAGAFYL